MPITLLRAAPDRLGGATVADRPERALAIQAPPHPSPLAGEGPGERGQREALLGIQALSVRDCPDLETLDLTGVAPGVHVTLEGCPRLRHLRLPSDGPGAVVHLDAGIAQPRLEIDGRIELFDASWDGEELAVYAPYGRPIDGCHVGESLAEVEGLHAEAAVILGDAATESSAISAGSRLRHLEIHAATGLERLQVHSPALSQLVLKDCPRLMQIEVAEGGIQRLRATRCPAVTEVNGDGGALTLNGNGTGADALTVKGTWNHLNAANLSVRTLTAPHVRELLLRGCQALRTIEVADDTAVSLSGQAAPAGLRIDRLNLDERAIEALLERAAEGDDAATRTLLDWPESARRPKTRLIALQGLLGLARQGVDPAEVWRRRCRLHLRNAEPNRQKLTDAEALDHAGRHWRWQFPDDLHQRGWDADLQLWLCCRGAAGTEGFEKAVRESADLTGLATLARELVRWHRGIDRHGHRREDAPPTSDDHPPGIGQLVPALTSGDASTTEPGATPECGGTPYFCGRRDPAAKAPRAPNHSTDTPGPGENPEPGKCGEDDAPTTEGQPRGSGRGLSAERSAESPTTNPGCNPENGGTPKSCGRRVPAATVLHRLLTNAITRQTAYPGGVRLRERPAWGPRRLALGTTEMDAVEQLIQVAVALRDRTIADALAAVGEPLSLEQRITVLGSLAAFGHGAARTGLIRLGGEVQQPSSHAMARAIDGLTKPERQALRQRAMGLALAPARSDALAEAREQEGGHAYA